MKACFQRDDLDLLILEHRPDYETPAQVSCWNKANVRAIILTVAARLMAQTSAVIGDNGHIAKNLLGCAQSPPPNIKQADSYQFTSGARDFAV